MRDNLDSSASQCNRFTSHGSAGGERDQTVPRSPAIALCAAARSSSASPVSFAPPRHHNGQLSVTVSLLPSAASEEERGLLGIERSSRAQARAVLGREFPISTLSSWGAGS